MPVLYDATTHYGIRYYQAGSDTSAAQVERHAAEVIDNALHGIQGQVTGLQVSIHSVAVPIAGIGAGDDDEIPLWVAPAGCDLHKISIVPKEGIVGADTDSFSVSILDKGSAGAGTDEIASLAFPLGVDAVAFAAKNIGTLDANHKVLAAGDVISFKKTESGSGMALPDSVCVIEYKLIFAD